VPSESLGGCADRRCTDQKRRKADAARKHVATRWSLPLNLNARAQDSFAVGCLAAVAGIAIL
jgi:hypothetical protein